MKPCTQAEEPNVCSQANSEHTREFALEIRSTQPRDMKFAARTIQTEARQISHRSHKPIMNAEWDSALLNPLFYFRGCVYRFNQQKFQAEASMKTKLNTSIAALI